MSRAANACRSSSRSIGTWTRSSAHILGSDDGLDAAPHRKISDDLHAARMDRADEVVEDLVGDVLVENAAVAEFDQVILQRLELDARRIGHVSNPDLPEIGQACFRTERCELRTIDGDLVVAVRPRVRKGLERRA